MVESPGLRSSQKKHETESSKMGVFKQGAATKRFGEIDEQGEHELQSRSRSLESLDRTVTQP